MADPVSLLVLALLFLKGGGASSKGGATANRLTTPEEFVKRATGARAAAWSPYFVDVGESPAVADALSRWAGIESGGDPTAVSSLDERGLLQAGKQTVSEGGMSQADWDDYARADTIPNTAARISVDYATWLFKRAAGHLGPIPANMTPTDRVWFAYQYHQRPADFTQWGQLPANAASAAAYLLGRAHLNNDPWLVKRVTASNVVAFGTPDAPVAPMVSGAPIVAQRYHLAPPDTIPPGSRVDVDFGDGVWHRGTVEQSGSSVTMDETGDSKTLYDPARTWRVAPIVWSS